MTTMAPSSSSVSAGERTRPASLSRIAWSDPDGMDYPEWLIAGRRLGAYGRASKWWIGDWLLFGSAAFGERYAEASRITGYDRKSLRNMRYVSARFDPSLRRDDLDWSHHVLLAGFEPDEQRDWLERAARERLFVEDLRGELRAARRGGYAPVRRRSPAAIEATKETAAAVCPNCGTTYDPNA
jgi:hypothetical protein